jgi:hypothetical protein
VLYLFLLTYNWRSKHNVTVTLSRPREPLGFCWPQFDTLTAKIALVFWEMAHTDRETDVIFHLHVNLVQIMRIYRTIASRSEMFWLKGNIWRKAAVLPSRCSSALVFNWCAATSWIEEGLYAMTMQIKVLLRPTLEVKNGWSSEKYDLGGGGGHRDRNFGNRCLSLSFLN